MKRIIAITATLLIMSPLLPSTAMADDPQGMDVGIAVVTPGDVDMGIGISAGGNVDVKINGVDWDSGLGLAMALRDMYSGGAISSGDWWMMKSKYLDPIFKRLFENGAVADRSIGITMEAIVKLIERTNSIGIASEVNRENTNALKSELNATVEALKAQDEKTWNQLMYGAEHHLSLLQEQVDAQAVVMSQQQNQVDYLQQQLSIASENNVRLTNYVDYLQRQYLYYFWIMGGGIVILAACFVVKFSSRREE